MIIWIKIKEEMKSLFIGLLFLGIMQYSRKNLLFFKY
jgi:hypothetical protein